jgi:hypothetical protein
VSRGASSASVSVAASRSLLHISARTWSSLASVISTIAPGPSSGAAIQICPASTSGRGNSSDAAGGARLSTTFTSRRGISFDIAFLEQKVVAQRRRTGNWLSSGNKGRSGGWATGAVDGDLGAHMPTGSPSAVRGGLAGCTSPTTASVYATSSHDCDRVRTARLPNSRRSGSCATTLSDRPHERSRSRKAPRHFETTTFGGKSFACIRGPLFPRVASDGAGHAHHRPGRIR